MARATIHLDPRAPRRKTGPPHRPEASDCRSLAHRSVLCSFFLHSVLSIVMPRRRRRSRASGVILTCGPSRTLAVSRGSRSTWRSDKRPRSITSVWSAGPCAVAACGAEAVRAAASRTPRDRAPPVRPEGVPPAVFPRHPGVSGASGAAGTSGVSLQAKYEVAFLESFACSTVIGHGQHPLCERREIGVVCDAHALLTHSRPKVRQLLGEHLADELRNRRIRRHRPHPCPAPSAYRTDSAASRASGMSASLPAR